MSGSGSFRKEIAVPVKSFGSSDGIARVSRSVAGPKRDITTRELPVFHPRGCLLGAVHHASVLRIGLRLQLEPWFRV